MENDPGHPAGFGPSPTHAGPATLSRARRRLWEILADQVEPVGIAALTALTGLHENTIREHLDGLAAAGLADRERAVTGGRGRPSWLWRAVDPPATSEYAGLAVALARTLQATSPDSVSLATRAGAEWGRELAATPADPDDDHETDAHERALRLLDGFGFGPQPSHPTRSGRTVRLTRCPLLQVARQHPDVVCAIHRGLVVGALEEYGDRRTEVDLEPFAEPGACLLHLRPGERP